MIICEYTCTHVTKLVTTITMAICANTSIVSTPCLSLKAHVATTSTTSELTGPQSLDGGFLSDDEDELDPLEYAESIPPLSKVDMCTTYHDYNTCTVKFSFVLHRPNTEAENIQCSHTRTTASGYITECIPSLSRSHQHPLA